MKIQKTFPETYRVKLNYQKPDGYWRVGHIERVTIQVPHGINEKNNFVEAEVMVKALYPGCHIVNVTLE
jgi:hypothetical protein